VKPRLARILDLISTVLEEGRSAVQDLRDSHRDCVALDQAFWDIPRELVAQDKTQFRVVVKGNPRPLHPEVRDEVYRIGREAVANAFRHAGAQSIEVELEYAKDRLHLIVRDDGHGIDPQTLQSGREGHWGLLGMRERAARISAQFLIRSSSTGSRYPMAGMAPKEGQMTR
jgi:signal transduction histidine kinase